MKKRALILVLIFFMIILIGSLYISNREKFEFEKYCTNNTGGFTCQYCDFEDEECRLTSGNLITEELDNKLRNICESYDGRYYCEGFCAGHYTRTCEFPFSDAGKECTNSSECNSGTCIANQADLDRLNLTYSDMKGEGANCSDCIGVCSKYPHNICVDNLPILENSRAMLNMASCD